MVGVFYVVGCGKEIQPNAKLTMQNTAPKRGAGPDDPIGLAFLDRDRPMGLSDGSGVRTGSSNAVRIQFCAPRRAPAAASLQSEGDLAVREGRRTRSERRPSGMSDREGARTTGGAGRVLSISCTCAKVTPEKQQTAVRDVKRGVSA